MFGLFKSAEKKLCDQMGESIHRQLYAITSRGEKVFNEPRELVFFAGYLEQLISSHAEYQACGGIWTASDEHKKYICEGVIPGVAWVLYQKGRGLVSLNTAPEFDVASVYELGKKAGWADSFDGITVSNRLHRFLTGQDLDLGLDDEVSESTDNQAAPDGVKTELEKQSFAGLKPYISEQDAIVDASQGLSEDFIVAVGEKLFLQYVSSEDKDSSPKERKRLKAEVKSPFGLGYFTGFCEATLEVYAMKSDRSPELFKDVCDKFGGFGSLHDQMVATMMQLNSSDVGRDDFNIGKKLGYADAVNSFIDPDYLANSGEVADNLRRYLQKEKLIIPESDVKERIDQAIWSLSHFQ